jgi:hypothetical protein
MTLYSFVVVVRSGSSRSCGRRLDDLHLEIDVDAIVDEDALLTL